MVQSLSEQLVHLFPDGLRGLIFDCDGVLIDSRAANIGYYNLLLRELGREPLTREQEDYAQMATSRQAIEQVMNDEELAKVPEICSRFPYSTVTLPMLKAEPGLTELVERLTERGLKLAIHTNRGDGIWDVLRNIGLTHAFNPVMTADEVAPKPSAEGTKNILKMWGFAPHQVAFVGDSPTDAGAAKGAGVPLFAYISPNLDADAHVNSFHTLREALEQVCIPASGK